MEDIATHLFISNKNNFQTNFTSCGIHSIVSIFIQDRPINNNPPLEIILLEHRGHCVDIISGMDGYIFELKSHGQTSTRSPTKSHLLIAGRGWVAGFKCFHEHAI
ncbi:hypothetical protein ACP275_05G115900 [Erythranthe tilingii]